MRLVNYVTYEQHRVDGRQREQSYLCTRISQTGTHRLQCDRSASRQPCTLVLNKTVFISRICTTSTALIQKDAKLLGLVEVVLPRTEEFLVSRKFKFPENNWEDGSALRGTLGRQSCNGYFCMI